MRILVKSIPLNWIKEKLGVKPNTVRKLDGEDTITIINTETAEQFTRIITDITQWNNEFIISFEKEYQENCKKMKEGESESNIPDKKSLLEAMSQKIGKEFVVDEKRVEGEVSPTENSSPNEPKIWTSEELIKVIHERGIFLPSMKFISLADHEKIIERSKIQIESLLEDIGKLKEEVEKEKLRFASVKKVLDEIELMTNQDCWDDERGKFRKSFKKRFEELCRRLGL